MKQWLAAALAAGAYLGWRAWSNPHKTIDLRYEAQPIIDPGYVADPDAFAASRGLHPGDYRLEVQFGGTKSERVVIRDVRAMNTAGVPVTRGARNAKELEASRLGASKVPIPSSVTSWTNPLTGETSLIGY